jgi:putative MATE family efflux protein
MPVHPRENDTARDLTAGSLERNLMRLAGPVAAGLVLQALYNVVDAFWLGHYSKAALAAQSVSTPFFFLVFALVQTVATAGSSVVAQYTGAGRHYDADRAAAQMFLVLSAFSVVLTLPLAVLAPAALRLAQAPPETVQQGALYMRIAMIGLPFMAFSAGYGGALRALGNTITIVIIGAATNLVNIVLDPILIYGWLGMPGMGVGGAAIATLTANVINALVCYACLRAGHVGLRTRRADLRPDRGMLLNIVRVAWPLGINRSSDSWGFFFYRVMINALGVTVLTAYTVGFRILQLFTLPAIALSQASAPMVGQALGAGRPALARRAVWVSTAIAAGVLVLPMLAMVFFGQAIAGLFTSDRGVIEETGTFFLVVPASTYMFQVIMVLSAAFIGSGNTRAPMMISLIRQWMFRLPVGYVLCFTLHMGSMGVYLGMVAGNVICAGVTLWVFLRGHWQRVSVAELREEAPQEGLPEAPQEA